MTQATFDRIRPELARIGHAGRVVVLSGAGLSADSGIPTFRGPEGYWTIGSEVYAPEAMATWAMFERRPEEVWAWYLYRLGVCRRAVPNSAHEAIFALREALGDRVAIVTQNVDGLHGRSGLTPDAMMEIHGNIEWMRRADDRGGRRRLPEGIPVLERGAGLLPEHRDGLRDQDGTWFRPHVLWFDECYDEENYHWESAQRAAAEADLLIVVGSSGATNLPRLMASIAAARGTLIVDVNPDPSPFAASAHEKTRGAWLQGTAGFWLPELVTELEREL